MTTKTATFSSSKALCVMMAIVVALAFMPQPAMAASKSVSKQAFSTKTEVVHKKAATVKKGTTKLTFKKGMGYIKLDRNSVV